VGDGRVETPVFPDEGRREKGKTMGLLNITPNNPDAFGRMLLGMAGGLLQGGSLKSALGPAIQSGQATYNNAEEQRRQQERLELLQREDARLEQEAQREAQRFALMSNILGIEEPGSSQPRPTAAQPVPGPGTFGGG